MNVKKLIIVLVFLILAILQLFVKKDNISSYESVTAFEKEV